MELIKRILILSLIALLPGCTVLGTYMEPLNPAPHYQIRGQVVRVNFIRITPTWVLAHSVPPRYVVGPFDILNVIVWDHPELTTVTTQLSSADQSGYLVSDQGTIAFPYVGILSVAGLDIPTIQTLIQKKISKYIRDPQVTVRVASFRSQQVQLMGEVGVRILPLTDKPLSLLQALNMAGGTNVMSSDTARIYVIRANNVDHVTVLALNAKSPEMMIAADHFFLRNNDIVYVPAIGMVDWTRIFAQVITFVSAGKATAGLAN